MTETIVKFILSISNNIQAIPFGREIIAFLLSASPILELRGGIIAGRLLGLDPIRTFIICYIGNILPVPFILYLIKSIIEKCKKSKSTLPKKFVIWVDKKVEKNRPKIEKYGFWSLILFVGIPLPGTGAWTGCLVAAMLDINKKKTFAAACVGVLMAGIIISLLSIGIIDEILH